MSIENDLYAKLRPLVADRVYPLEFPQEEAAPTWPAIRFTLVSIAPATTICGDSGDKSATTRVQLDAVTRSYDQTRALRLAILTAMKTFAPPAVLDGSREDRDPETKTYRAGLDFLVYASSPAV